MALYFINTREGFVADVINVPRTPQVILYDSNVRGAFPFTTFEEADATAKELLGCCKAYAILSNC
jgi:hypothetical protein